MDDIYGIDIYPLSDRFPAQRRDVGPMDQSRSIHFKAVQISKLDLVSAMLRIAERRIRIHPAAGRICVRSRSGARGPAVSIQHLPFAITFTRKTPMLYHGAALNIMPTD
jgi:hypothetical protein